jgi:beta-glucanase (GH16 family)
MRNKWVMVFVLLFSGSVFAQNLLTGGGFESDAPGWTTWNATAITDQGNGGNPLPSVGRSSAGGYGDFAAKAWGAWSGPWGDSGFVQSLSATPGETYILSGDIIVLSNDAITSDAFAVLKIVFKDSNGDEIFGQDVGRVDSSSPTGIWSNITTTVTAPAETTAVEALCLFFQPSGDGVGAAYWDNISLISLETVNTLNSPDYDNSLTVDLLDYAKLAGAWNQTSSTLNLSGTNLIDLEDLQFFADAWLGQITPYPGYELVWSDEFYGSVINSQNWTHETGTGPNFDGWGNWEWQYYTDRSENSRIENGKLVIEARKESYEGMGYTSARLTTQGKQSFQYGKIEARIKLPSGGRGIWPAFWMLGDNITTAYWPACGELDIMEMIWDPYEALGTIHYGSNSPYDHQDDGGSRNIGVDLSADFHVYGVEWESDTIRFYMDGVNYFTTTDAIWWSNVGSALAPFDQPFFILLNFAYGAWWADPEDLTVTFPQQLEIDYVRVYQKTTP